MPHRETKTIEFCIHRGTYDDRGKLIEGENAHPLGPPVGFNRGGGNTYADWCPGGRTLTDAEALRALLFEKCHRCRGGGDEEHGPGGVVTGPCPACGGSGRTPKDGVVPGIRMMNGSVLPSHHRPAEAYIIPATMLEDPEGS